MVGGTGILRPAALALARAGAAVTVVARGARSDVAAGIAGAAVDVTDVPALERALDRAVAARGLWSLALVYAPFASAAAQAAIARRVDGLIVHVLTSRWGAPDARRSLRDAWAPDGAGTTRRLTLGWVVDPDGAPSRWHTPLEVSEAALRAALDAGSEHVLGTLRPWQGRPR